MYLRKKEVLAFLLILTVSVILILVFNVRRESRDCGSIRITVSGEEYGTYPLARNMKIKINGTNTCRIKDGSAQMIEADCPDHLCIHQGAIDNRGGMIICLPNEVVIESIPSGQAQTDELIPDIVAG